MMVSEGEYLFIYNSNKLEERRAKGYVMALDHIAINERDIYKDPLTETQVADVAKKLNLPIQDLCRTEEFEKKNNFDDDELLGILARDPVKMKTPIILSTEKSFIVGTAYELIKEKMEIHSSDDEHAENTKNE